MILLSTLLLLFLVTTFKFAQSQPPLASCDGFYGCISSLRQSDCAPGEVLISGASLDGCCPGCRGGQGYMQVCNVNVPNRRCAPGLKCDRKCLYDQSEFLRKNFATSSVAGTNQSA
uniref:(northern house mosquito) hypothetical protein n=1 Tax=Culex pipiens TaxID=7175 RepID=A0A8D8CCL6_CULPI